MKLVLFLSVILSVLTSTAANHKGKPSRHRVFSCQSQHSPMDPQYTQGSEVFLDIYYRPKLQAFELQYYPMDANGFEVFSTHTQVSHNIDLTIGAIVIRWQAPDWQTYAGMVFLGDLWGFVLPIPKEYQNKQLAGRELELLCSETAFFKDTFE